MGGGQSDIADILGELQRGPILNEHRDKIDALMRHFARAGLTIATVCDARHLDRAVSTVRGYARELDLIFPDYTPRHLRPKKEPKRKKAA
jgi:hypothetical protein